MAVVCYSQVTTPVSFFARCYSHLTGQRVPVGHPLLVDSVRRNDHKVSLENCMKVFDKARLQPYNLAPVAPGYAKTSTLVNPNDTEGVQVLNYFFGIYNSFFEEKSYANMPQVYASSPQPFFDQSEDALYFLKATFQGNAASSSTQQFGSQINYDYIVTATESLMGRRVLPTKISHTVNHCSSYGSNCNFTPINGTYVWNNMPSWNWQDGLGSSPGIAYLTGIKTWPKDHNTLYTVDGTEIKEGEVQISPASSRVVRSHGGGILGASSYIIKNGQYSGQTDGAVENRRRAVKNAFSALLCRDMPPLKLDSSIVLKKVSDYNNKGFATDYKLSFRESATCASCHVSYDEAAAVYRNTNIYQQSSPLIDWNSDGDFHSAAGVSPQSVTSNLSMDRYAFIASHLVTNNTIPEPNFVNGVSNNGSTSVSRGIYPHTQLRASKPTGALYFEDWRGQMVDIPLSATSAEVHSENAGIQELGEAMAQTDQFYVCFAKRLFAHFTGIDVSLEDHSDSRLPPLTATELYYRDKYVVPLALGDNSGLVGFKNHKSVRRLVYDIMNTGLYKSQTMRDVIK